MGAGYVFGRYTPSPPPDRDTEWRGLVKWPWFTARRRGHLLEQRVEDLERRLAWMDWQLSEMTK